MEAVGVTRRHFPIRAQPIGLQCLTMRQVPGNLIKIAVKRTGLCGGHDGVPWRHRKLCGFHGCGMFAEAR